MLHFLLTDHIVILRICSVRLIDGPDALTQEEDDEE
jgi:hypothetical protein